MGYSLKRRLSHCCSESLIPVHAVEDVLHEPQYSTLGPSNSPQLSEPCGARPNLSCYSAPCQARNRLEDFLFVYPMFFFPTTLPLIPSHRVDIGNEREIASLLFFMPSYWMQPGPCTALVDRPRTMPSAGPPTNTYSLYNILSTKVWALSLPGPGQQTRHHSPTPPHVGFFRCSVPCFNPKEGGVAALLQLGRRRS